MIGCPASPACLLAWRFGDESQQPTFPQVRHNRRWTHQPPIFRHSSQPSADGLDVADERAVACMPRSGRARDRLSSRASYPRAESAIVWSMPATGHPVDVRRSRSWATRPRSDPRSPRSPRSRSSDRPPGGAVDADACVGRLRRSLTHLEVRSLPCSPSAFASTPHGADSRFADAAGRSLAGRREGAEAFGEAQVLAVVDRDLDDRRPVVLEGLHQARIELVGRRRPEGRQPE